MRYFGYRFGRALFASAAGFLSPDRGRMALPPGLLAGDGVTDAPSLAAAEVGIVMGTGTDVAMESAGVTLLKGDLGGIVRARRLSQPTMSNIVEGHVLAIAIRRLLEERPDAAGVAVAGMPAGSPGMGGKPQQYPVVLFGQADAARICSSLVGRRSDRTE